MLAYVYIACHDARTYEKAETLKQMIETPEVHVRILTLCKSPLFENQAFKLMNIERHMWEAADFVGLISYAVLTKCRLPKLDIQTIVQYIDKDVDVISFVNFEVYWKTVELDMYEHALLYHNANFVTAWNTMLSAHGVSEAEMQKPVDCPFYCNSFIAKPHAMKEYLDFNMKCQNLLENDKTVRDALMLEASYPDGKLDEAKLEDIFGCPYWTQVPFVFERLAPWFFQGKYKVQCGTPVMRYMF